MRLLSLTALIFLFSGCATHPLAPPPQIATPAPGGALIYLFRPALDKTGTWAAPHLYVNGTRLTQIPASSYVAVPVSSGVHTLELRPGGAFGGSWTASAKFCAEPDKVYFAAIWNQGQPLNPRTLALPLPGGGGIIAIPLGPTSHQGTVVFETVDSELGRESLAGLAEAKIDPAVPPSIPAQASACSAA